MNYTILYSISLTLYSLFSLQSTLIPANYIANNSLNYRKLMTKSFDSNLSRNQEIKASFIDKRSFIRFGKLIVIKNSVRTLNQIRVVQAYNSSYQPLYLGVECNRRLIIVTGKANAWKEWFSPTEEFEFDLMTFICK